MRRLAALVAVSLVIAAAGCEPRGRNGSRDSIVTEQDRRELLERLAADPASAYSRFRGREVELPVVVDQMRYGEDGRPFLIGFTVLPGAPRNAVHVRLESGGDAGAAPGDTATVRAVLVGPVDYGPTPRGPLAGFEHGRIVDR